MKKITKTFLPIFLILAVTMGICFPQPMVLYAGNNDFTIDNHNVLTGYTGTGGIVKVPEGVRTIGKRAFAGCGVISKIEMPDSVQTIESGAFDSCGGLVSVSFSQKLTTIGDHAFWGCQSLKSLSIPESVKTIDDGAFVNCDALTDVYIPKTVKNIGKHAFGYLYYANYTQVIDFTVMGEKNSAAAIYAKECQFPFITKNDLKVSLSSVKRTSANKISVKWKKNDKTDGYEICYSTDKKFPSSKTKTIRVGKNSVTSKTISGLKKGKTYYIKIRGYRTVSGKKYYSTWGKALKK